LKQDKHVWKLFYDTRTSHVQTRKWLENDRRRIGVWKISHRRTCNKNAWEFGKKRKKSSTLNYNIFERRLHMQESVNVQCINVQLSFYYVNYLLLSLYKYLYYCLLLCGNKIFDNKYSQTYAIYVTNNQKCLNKLCLCLYYIKLSSSHVMLAVKKHTCSPTYSGLQEPVTLYLRER
jgi:hypothetical protein